MDLQMKLMRKRYVFEDSLFQFENLRYGKDKMT